ncbi:MAG: CPBP family intramembrane glutamic endopeptidase [Bacillota bacterium]
MISTKRSSVQHASILVLIAVVFLIIFGSLLQSLHYEAGIALTQWIFFLVPALVYLKLFSQQPAVFARFRPLQSKFLPAIVLLAVSAWVSLVFVEGIILSALSGLGFEPLEKIPPPTTVNQLLIYILIIAVSPAICEEILFRGAVMPSMERYGMLPALLFSALLFALMHMSFLSLTSTFVLGLLIGLVVLKTGSLYAGMLYHFLNNLIAVTFMYYMHRFDLEALLEGSEAVFTITWLTVTGLAFGGVLIGLLLLQRQSRVNRILPSRGRLLPQGWINWASILIAVIFLFSATVELLIGFGLFNFLDAGR